jgi:EAL domain-containing protein (putative c-di-GMP-specific phosphodiesterase class I)/GAF domain-containing protein/GGDEF domain-containing protein
MTDTGELPVTPDHAAICEAEPITTPGRIQGFGALIAFDIVSGRVQFASQEAGQWLDCPDLTLPGATLAQVLPDEAITRIYTLLRAERYAPTNFTSLMTREGQLCDAMVHQNGDLAIVECMAPGDPVQGARSVSGAQAALTRLRQTESLDALLDAAVQEVRYLTGYARAMVYRFDDDGHGCVTAESRREELEPYLGLHYPATDIPSQARRMYQLQRVRIIPDVNAPIEPVLAAPELDPTACDMTYAVLRAVSPYHLDYLRNMGVRATLAISLVVDGRLWGMLVCHHDAPRMIDCTLRGLCDMLGQSLSEMIATRHATDLRKALARRAQALQQIEHALDEADRLADALALVERPLLHVMQASGAFVSIGGRQLCLGITPGAARCNEIHESLVRHLADSGRLHGGWHSLGETEPAFADLRLSASGAYVLLVPNTPKDGLVLFRPERTLEVAWGGDPNNPFHIDETSGQLGPRRSFAKWVEVVQGTSARWDETDERMAVALRRILAGALLRIAEERVGYLAQHESDSGLLKRQALEARFRRIVASTPESFVAIFLITPAHRDAIAALHGPAGAARLDVVCRERIDGVIGRRDHLGRFDDDTLMLVARRKGVEELHDLGQALVERVRGAVQIDGREHLLHIRVGCAAHPDHPAGEVLAAAARALSEAKTDARARFVMHDAAAQPAGPSRAELVLEIGPAIARGDLRAVFQPLVNLSSDKPVGLEALCRLRSRVYGGIPPVAFIPAAIEAGQIFQLTTTMLDLALKHAKPWLADGTIDFVSVNLDASVLARRSISAVVRSALDSHRLPYRALVLEVTETSLCSPDAVEGIRRLREDGVRIALDDFGAGYSSLGELARLPVDIVKIDRKLIEDIDVDPKRAAIFAAVRNLVATLEIHCIAEGLETPAQRCVLSEHDLLAVQGYLLARPMEAEDLANYLSKLCA